MAVQTACKMVQNILKSKFSEWNHKWLKTSLQSISGGERNRIQSGTVGLLCLSLLKEKKKAFLRQSEENSAKPALPPSPICQHAQTIWERVKVSLTVKSKTAVPEGITSCSCRAPTSSSETFSSWCCWFLWWCTRDWGEAILHDHASRV